MAKLPSLNEALLDLLWRQWHELGAPAARRKSAETRCIIDPEALALCSLAMVHSEPRLGDVLVSWCSTNSQHLSVQRMNNLARAYPSSAHALLPALARVMVKSGKDLRWRPLAVGMNTIPEVLVRRSAKQSVSVPLERPSAFLLRMRAIFGLGLRADIIVFLLRKRDPRDYADAGEIASALGYNRAAVKRTLDILAAAEAISVTDGLDPGYSIGWTHTYELLSKDVDRLPHWKYVHQTFLWVLALLESDADLTNGTEFLRELVVGRLLRDHSQFLTSQTGLFDHSEIKRKPAPDRLIRNTVRWLNEL